MKPMMRTTPKIYYHSSTSTSNYVTIVEVGPRDGLQNEKQTISVDQKIQLITKLQNCGLKHIEVGSFVSPKWIPQMANSDQVLHGLLKLKQQQKDDNDDDVTYSVLVPNIKGLEMALQEPINEMVDEIAIFTAASEEFSKRNINSAIDESIERFRILLNHLQQYQQNNSNKNMIQVRGYVSTVIACPYQGPIQPTQVAKVVEQMLDLGCYEVSLGDTIGVGTPGTTRNMLKEVLVRL